MLDFDPRGPHRQQVARLEGPGKVVDLRPGPEPGEDGLHRVVLCLVRAVVDVEHEAPRRAFLVVAIPSGQNDAEPAEVEPARFAVHDLPRERAQALVVGRATAHDAVDAPARADRLAVTRLEGRARYAPGGGGK